MAFWKRFFPLLLFAAILGAVIYFIEPPKSWTEASIFQILIFFIPLLFLFTFVINLFLNFLPKSFAVGLGLMFLTVLWAVGQLNIVTLILTFAAVFFLSNSFPFNSFPKTQRTHLSQKGLPQAKSGGLTLKQKPPTLTKRF